MFISNLLPHSNFEIHFFFSCHVQNKTNELFLKFKNIFIESKIVQQVFFFEVSPKQPCGVRWSFLRNPKVDVLWQILMMTPLTRMATCA